MFDFLFKNKNDEIVSYLDMIDINTKKIMLHKAAINKAINMIAKAIAKSEIVLNDGKQRRYDEHYYRLNVRPNDNETGTDFWMSVIQKLLRKKECLICRIGNKYYIVDNYQENDYILRPRTYSNISISLKGNSIRLDKLINADDMIVLRWRNEKQSAYYESVTKIYSDTLSIINTVQKITSNPKFKLKIDSQTSFRERLPDGTTKTIVREEYIKRLKAKLEADDVTIIDTPVGIELDYMTTSSNSKVDDISKLAREIESECAKAFDIPEAVFFGNITEKSDATNEFITYAVSPVAEVINDSLNAKLVGMEDYIKGERIQIWLSRFKHIDVIDSASNLEKLRGIGFSLDEIRDMVGYDRLNSEFSQKRLYTKNFAEEGEEMK